ncbi:endonuclease [Thiorhodospira sibirica]|uniref:endonuclease n=1 Tax=Thiorhodospira sibirica TaxID=154347 RepID=UPI00022C463A|nr:endonuclease [Thiorhodospira sibirica]
MPRKIKTLFGHKLTRQTVRRAKQWTASLSIGLVLLVVFSFLPDSMVRDLPKEVQESVELAEDVRRFVVRTVGEGGAFTGDAALELLYIFRAIFPKELRDLLPSRDEIYIPVAPGELPRTAASFSLARQALYERVDHDRRLTLYCGCRYDRNGQVDLKSCELEELQSIERARRVEAEHVFPASQFGNFRPCWREPESFAQCRSSTGNVLSGRECCLRTDATFVAAHNDLHNLFPAVGHINGQRSNYTWGTTRFGERYGACEMVINSRRREATPPEAVRGAIARSMLYMRDTYGFRLSRQDEKLYTAWNRQYPPEAWEITRNQRIRVIQGMSNPYIENYQRMSGT